MAVTKGTAKKTAGRIYGSVFSQKIISGFDQG
jgi:hypothetical protein